MQGNANAAGIIGVVLLTFLLLKRVGERRTTVLRVIAGILAAVLVSFLSIALTVHMCKEGQPVVQWAVPSGCIVLLTAFIRSGSVRRQAISGMALAAVVLSFQFMGLVHEPGYTGNPEWKNSLGERLACSCVESVHDAYAKVPATADTVYPAGWMDESPARAVLPKLGRELVDASTECEGYRAYRLWHTWFTGLYGVRHAKTYRLWYPGGRLREGIAGLTWREKPS